MPRNSGHLAASMAFVFNFRHVGVPTWVTLLQRGVADSSNSPELALPSSATAQAALVPSCWGELQTPEDPPRCYCYVMWGRGVPGLAVGELSDSPRSSFPQLLEELVTSRRQTSLSMWKHRTVHWHMNTHIRIESELFLYAKSWDSKWAVL